MDKKLVFEKVKELGLLAVLRGPSEEKTVKAVDALVAGGVKGIEITFFNTECTSRSKHS